MKHTPHRSVLVKLWNVLALVPPATPARLSLERIVARVRRKLPESGWQTGPHLDAAGVLVAALNETGNLHPFGCFYLSEMFAGLLKSRARLEALWSARPNILEERIVRPLIILGLPRSGTSLLFNLLAKDPAHRYLRNWETTVSQIPPEAPTTFERDPRRRTGRLLMFFQNHLAPRLKHIHEFYLDGPEECTPLLMQGFATQALAGIFNVPAYSQWLDGVDHQPTYAHHRRILQTLQATYPSERWLLKSPDHLPGLDALLAAYPDACLIHLHRDPVQSVASWASLNAAFRGICSREVDEVALGAQVLERLATDMDAYIAARGHHDPQHFLDLPYQALIADPLATVQRIYTHFDLPLGDAASWRIADFLAADREKTRSHHYAPQDFGLTPERIHERFAAYLKRFDVPVSREAR